jgi:hypothetical protein
MLVAATELPLPLLRRGKVRDVYSVDADRVLLVATDRVSAFDVVMRETIPFKGAVLTQITAWWLGQLEGRVRHHMISASTSEIIAEIPAARRRTLASYATASCFPSEPKSSPSSASFVVTSPALRGRNTREGNAGGREIGLRPSRVRTTSNAAVQSSHQSRSRTR